MQNMHPGVLCGMGLSWNLPTPLHFGQVVAAPGMAPDPLQPAHTVQKMQPGPCGMVLRWTFPEPPHWMQACTAGAFGVAPIGAKTSSAGTLAVAPTGVPQFEQKLALLDRGEPHDEQNMFVIQIRNGCPKLR